MNDIIETPPSPAVLHEHGPQARVHLQQHSSSNASQKKVRRKARSNTTDAAKRSLVAKTALRGAGGSGPAVGTCCTALMVSVRTDRACPSVIIGVGLPEDRGLHNDREDAVHEAVELVA